MIVSIGTPAPKALSANEKRVYQLLKEGKAPFEIAKKLHLPIGSVNDFGYNVHDVPPDTVVNIISSIRSKGYEIPEIKKEEKPMAKITEEMKREMITLRNSGMKVNKIAEKFGVGKSIVYGVIKAYSEQGERAFNDNAPTFEEMHDHSMDYDEDAHRYEVTPDTDIEAYMAETEKEPETAATESGSETEIVEENISAPIVSPSEENVKTESAENEPLIPQSVIEACWGRIDDLRHQIAQEQAVIDDWKRQIAEINEFLELARIANPVGGNHGTAFSY